MTGRLLPVPGLRAMDQNGEPMAGARLQMYLSGTTTPTPVYVSTLLSSPMSNPIVADSTGLFPAMFCDPAIAYRAQLFTSSGMLVADIDPVAAPTVNPSGSITGDMLASGAAVANLGFIPVNRDGDTASNLLLQASSLSVNSAGYLGAPVSEQDSAYTLCLSDAGKMIRCNSSASVSYIIPLNSAVAFPVGTVVLLRNVGAGVLTVHVTSGVSLSLAGGAPQGSVGVAQYGLATMVQDAPNAWVMSGVGLS